MIDSDQHPLLKSASTDVIISKHGPIYGYLIKSASFQNSQIYDRFIGYGN